jgi:D-alanyl-D-alanine dipeptidase
LVELVDLVPDLRLDVRYATAHNFVGRPVYPQARVFLQRPAAEAVARVQQRLRPSGYGLLVFDGYRPWSVTRLFWAVVDEAQRPYVADPAEGSRHNRGCAVDLSLVDLGSGREVSMPSLYDEMSAKAHPDYDGGTAQARKLRDFLRAAMEAEGYTVHPREWWHFDYQDSHQYAILDLPFSAIGT